AFSLGGESSTWLFTTFQLVFLLGVIAGSPFVHDRFQAIALAMIAGGAGGNLIDRLFREPGFWFGHVVDFISVGDFAIFNVADSFITVGVGLFLVAVLTEERRVRAAGSDDDGEDSTSTRTNSNSTNNNGNEVAQEASDEH
uniref:signal peptidase II n=1 Tax=Corynebacterium sp. TaxID=1720 RepID=UPI0027B94A93